MKRKFASILAVAFALALGLAQAESGPWLTSYKDALAQAASSGKPILANFTGSDWCPYCIALEKKVLSKKAFTSFAAENLTLLLVDFPMKKTQSATLKKQNDMLATKFDIKEYPTLVLISAKGKEIARYPGDDHNGVGGLISWVKKNAPQAASKR